MRDLRGSTERHQRGPRWVCAPSTTSAQTVSDRMRAAIATMHPYLEGWPCGSSESVQQASSRAGSVTAGSVTAGSLTTGPVTTGPVTAGPVTADHVTPRTPRTPRPSRRSRHRPSAQWRHHRVLRASLNRTNARPGRPTATRVASRIGYRIAGNLGEAPARQVRCRKHIEVSTPEYSDELQVNSASRLVRQARLQSNPGATS